MATNATVSNIVFTPHDKDLKAPMLKFSITATHNEAMMLIQSLATSVRDGKVGLEIF